MFDDNHDLTWEPQDACVKLSLSFRLIGPLFPPSGTYSSIVSA